MDRLIEEALTFPHKQSAGAFQRQLEAFRKHDTLERLSRVAAPTLVLAGGQDLATPPRLGHMVADKIADAQFELLPEEAHQPFQEVPEAFNARVHAFWREVQARG